MRLDIIISTLHRENKLARCLTSILANTYKDWRIVIQHDLRQERIFRVVNREVKHMVGDFAILLCDDTELYRDCLDQINRCAETLFPDTDGVIGLNQVNIKGGEGTSESAMVAVGRKFIERFGDHPLLCPDYQAFGADTELGKYAQSVGKFKFCEDAKLMHYHPSYFPNEMDETHNALRKNGEVHRDNKLYSRRVHSMKLLWGRDFTLVGS